MGKIVRVKCADKKGPREEPWGCPLKNASKGKAEEGRPRKERLKGWAWPEVSDVVRKMWMEKPARLGNVEVTGAL